ncbi:MAG TPA: protein-methionine-sulfoxide reductase heme-binding subunit MsrQ [Silvibacterium sp.]|nr:protein-methionine-sulfoxide reductase heme-binding subunit MsrQ [Silvibacterium sp.]
MPKRIIPNRTIVVLKILVHIACLVPVAWLLVHLFQNKLGPDPTHTVTFFTGRGTLRLLVITLAISPIRRLFPRFVWIIRFRRMLGLYAFFYGCLHLMTYLWLYAGFSWAAIVDDISHRRFILAGVTAWLLMVPLALTSTAWSIRKLGGKNWTRLHWLTYLAALAGVVHYWWGVKQGDNTPAEITIVLAIVLAARPLLAWVRSRNAIEVSH